MKPVTQKDEYGCGIACVAFLLSEKYDSIRNVINYSQAQLTGFICKELVLLLAKFELNYTYKYIKPSIKRYIYTEGIIIFIKRSKKYPSGHYLIRHESGWMDPWINFYVGATIKNATSGFRKHLPGKPIYGLFPKDMF